jgi:hypothetical protein
MGDRAGEAVIVEGLETSTYSHDGARLKLVTVYMQTYCHACKKTGFICPSGPRLPGTAENGKLWALSGDINICDCKPAPVFWAQRNMTMRLTGEDIAHLSMSSAASLDERSARHEFNEKFVLLDESGVPVAFTAYAVERESGHVEHGVSDADGHTHVLAQTQSAERVKIYVE